jgi:Pyridoxamine 5'-phosphate oxidase
MPSRRDQIRITAAELAGFLDEQKTMQVATIGANGRPHLMPLWFVVEEGSGDAVSDAAAAPDNVPVLRGWTFAKSQKAKNLERDPRATVGIETGVEYQELRGATFECDVEVERDPEAVVPYGMALFERYGPGGELAPEVREMVLAQARKRVGLRFVPTRVVTWDHRKLGGTY